MYMEVSTKRQLPTIADSTPATVLLQPIAQTYINKQSERLPISAAREHTIYTLFTPSNARHVSTRMLRITRKSNPP